MGERSAQLYLEVSDTIHDDATLELSGNGYDSSTQDRITISSGVVEQIGRLIIDGEQKASGTYTKADGFIDGDGTLIVGTTTTTTTRAPTTTQAARTTTITTTTTTTTTITTQLAITTKITTTATPTPTTTPTTTATTTTTITSTTSTTTSTTTVPISRVSPWNCALNPEPVQVYESASMENAYDVSKLDFATGFYDFLYHIPMKLPYASGAPVSHWNSVGYNPIDSRMYATMKVDDADFFLVRFAENQLEFVAKLPVPPENSDVNEYNAGAFGHSGTYYLSTTPTVHLFTIKGLANHQGYPEHTSAGLVAWNWESSQISRVLLTDVRRTADIVVTLGTYDGTGEAEYLFLLSRPGSAGRSDLKVVKVSEPTYQQWTLSASGGASSLSYGSGWNFNGRLYFSSNTGGVYEIEQETIDFHAGTVHLSNVGMSVASTQNDGTSCLATQGTRRLAHIADTSADVAVRTSTTLANTIVLV
mmetsp:Transcript_60309/g.95795  ORF Transcript_60309/g.95795 Transcript_60309/m.95795 type:complete len:476 (-) Transcript_60309:119-1546(-)